MASMNGSPLPGISGPAVEAVDLVKNFDDNVAVDRISFAVPTGSVLGILGPNGAGKTTTVRMLTTMSRPTSGTGRVAGHDILQDPDAVRRSMGLTGQVATVDELLTGRENIRLIGRFAGLSDAQVRQRRRRAARAVLARPTPPTGSPRPTRAACAAGSTSRSRWSATPPVLFLDEPTTGLDPRSRTELWEVLRGLVADGTTLLLTTQYLEEADQLADDIIVIDKGRVIAQGTPTQLKDQAGRASVVVDGHLRRRPESAAAARRAAPPTRCTSTQRARRITAQAERARRHARDR